MRGILKIAFVALVLLIAGTAALIIQDQLPKAQREVFVANAIRVFKSERRMELLLEGQVKARYAIALGGNPLGHKQQEGDERTPEGRYAIDWRNPNSRYFLSLHISYPDETDRNSAAERGVSPGGDIMIHGLPNNYGATTLLLQNIDWTNGCIAVTNEDMQEIWDSVPDGTPIEIMP